jgi:hypothetical protein
MLRGRAAFINSSGSLDYSGSMDDLRVEIAADARRGP